MKNVHILLVNQKPLITIINQKFLHQHQIVQVNQIFHIIFLLIINSIFQHRRQVIGQFQHRIIIFYSLSIGIFLDHCYEDLILSQATSSYYPSDYYPHSSNAIYQSCMHFFFLFITTNTNVMNVFLLCLAAFHPMPISSTSY
jgi:hypothetical protein